MISKKNTGIIALLIFVAAATRLLPHPPNMTPIGAMSLFGAAYFGKKYLSILVPFAALFLSNLVLDNVVYAQYNDAFVLFRPQTLWVYGSIAAIAFMGMLLLKKVTFPRVLVGALSASVIFFLVTNFGSWLSDPVYTKDFSGLMQSYAAGIPFFRNTILGDLLFSGALFGIYQLATQRKMEVA